MQTVHDGRCDVQVCRGNGYFPVVDMQNFTDLWAFCVLRVAIRNNNTGDPDNILYDQPLGWWDTDWPGERLWAFSNLCGPASVSYSACQACCMFTVMRHSRFIPVHVTICCWAK